LIEADGTDLSPLSVDTFPIHVAQRYSFILVANQTASSYWIRAVMNTNCFNGDNDQLNPDIFAVLQYNNTPVSVPNTTAWDDQMDSVCRDLNLTELVPLQTVPLLDSTLFVRVDVSFQTGAGDLNFGYINATTWVPLNGTNILNQVSINPNGGNVGTQGLDTSDFAIKNQFVYSLPDVQTVEYILSCFNLTQSPYQ
jgi:FtsP/CotA-like multicopper oxidase with cupredoxin domain